METQMSSRGQRDGSTKRGVEKRKMEVKQGGSLPTGSHPTIMCFFLHPSSSFSVTFLLFQSLHHFFCSACVFLPLFYFVSNCLFLVCVLPFFSLTLSFITPPPALPPSWWRPLWHSFPKTLHALKTGSEGWIGFRRSSGVTFCQTYLKKVKYGSGERIWSQENIIYWCKNCVITQTQQQMFNQ